MVDQELGMTPRGDYRIVEINPLAEGTAPEDDAAPTPSPEFLAWIRATSQGFHAQDLDDEEIAARLKNRLEDGRRFIAAYPTAERPAEIDKLEVAATFSTFDGTVNVGGTLVDADLITSVTVRTSDRRRGLLSSMMKLDLERAVDRGQPLALLTASEATIYRRFGFGKATYNHAISLDTRSPLALTREVPGTVYSVAPDTLFNLSQELFDTFHARTNGSVTRSIFYPLAVSGRITESSSRERNKKARAAVYYDGDARPGGYVAYEVASEDEWPVTVKVSDLVATTLDAYLALWQYMGSIDLVDKVTFTEAPAIDPLPFALSDSRTYKVTGREDLLWVRILDVATALEARAYLQDGEFAITVEDPLGHAAGTYLVRISEGRATVSRAEEASNAVVLHVADLGVLLFGGVDPIARSAGMELRTGAGESISPSARKEFAEWFRQEQEPYCLTHF
ncbi:GNAT family N-acetyltransferase [Haematomicrobium sanguinis]|uniref:GNAT family N-acetyltransferase n=1 Tax=Haematomicrobium sanguinis TaxID=479106 RepID=UPI00068F78AC|nr:GNAT family N-acetyltransferase [Haematomicrobium sanguinis]